VDIRAAWGRPIGAVAIPVLAVGMILVVAASLLALVVLAERPTARLRDVLRASLYLAVRHWYLTVFSLAVLALLYSLVASRPALAFGLASAPLLYVVWANSRFTLRAALGLAPGLARQA
jgi:ABC-type transport system involved in multi-copper enzyme maturation permease subunit